MSSLAFINTVTYCWPGSECLISASRVSWKKFSHHSAFKHVPVDLQRCSSELAESAAPCPKDRFRFLALCWRGGGSATRILSWLHLLTAPSLNQVSYEHREGSMLPFQCLWQRMFTAFLTDQECFNRNIQYISLTSCGLVPTSIGLLENEMS